MKCPYCGIHYMDEERECPICGKRNPGAGAAARETAHHHAGTPGDTPTTTCSHVDDPDQDRSSRRYRDTDKYPSIRHAETEVPKPASAPAKPAHKSGAAKSTSSPATSGTPEWGEKKQKKSGVGAVVAVIVIALATQFVPPLIALGTQLMDEVRYSGQTPVQVIEEMLNGTAVPEPEPEPEPARTTPPAFWSVNANSDLGITLALDGDNSAYALTTPAREETGTFYWWYNDEDFNYTDAFPQDTYDCYTLCLEISTSVQTGGTLNDPEELCYYLDAYFPADDPEAPMAVVPSLDPPVWMEDDTPIVLTRQ